MQKMQENGFDPWVGKIPYKEKIGLQKDEEENLVMYFIFLYYSYLKSYPNQNPIVDFERLLTL